MRFLNIRISSLQEYICYIVIYLSLKMVDILKTPAIGKTLYSKKKRPQKRFAGGVSRESFEVCLYLDLSPCFPVMFGCKLIHGCYWNNAH